MSQSECECRITEQTELSKLAGRGFGTAGAVGSPAGTGFGTTAFGAKPAGTAFGTTAFGASPSVAGAGTPTAGGTPSAFGTTAFGATPGAAGTPAAGGAFSTAFGAKPATGTAFGTPGAAGTAFGTPGTAGTAFGTPGTAGTAFGAAGAAGSPAAFSAFGKPAGTAAFGAFGSPSGAFGTPGVYGAQAAAAPAEPTVLDRLYYYQHYYTTNSLTCPFRFAFYDMKQYEQQTEAPAEFHEGIPNQELLQRAQAANPDPARLIPVQKAGFEGLEKRVAKQEEFIRLYNEQLERAMKVIEQVKQNHERLTMNLELYRENHAGLTQRALHLLSRMEVIQGKGYSIFPEEEVYRARLENMQRELNKPTQFKGLLNEVHSRVRRQEAIYQESYESLDAEYLRMVFEHLSQLKEGLAHLMQFVCDDMRDLETITNTLESES